MYTCRQDHQLICVLVSQPQQTNLSFFFDAPAKPQREFIITQVSILFKTNTNHINFGEKTVCCTNIFWNFYLVKKCLWYNNGKKWWVKTGVQPTCMHDLPHTCRILYHCATGERRVPSFLPSFLNPSLPPFLPSFLSSTQSFVCSFLNFDNQIFFSFFIHFFFRTLAGNLPLICSVVPVLL